METAIYICINNITKKMDDVAFISKLEALARMEALKGRGASEGWSVREIKLKQSLWLD